MVMQNGRYVTVNFIAEKLSHYQFLFNLFFLKVFYHHPLDAVEAFPDFSEGGVQRGEAKPDVIRFAEVGDDVYLFNHSAVDAIAVRVANADVRAALGRIPRGA